MQLEGVHRVLIVGGAEDDGRARPAERGRDLEPAAARHLDVEQHQIGRQFLRRARSPARRLRPRRRSRRRRSPASSCRSRSRAGCSSSTSRVRIMAITSGTSRRRLMHQHRHVVCRRRAAAVLAHARRRCAGRSPRPARRRASQRLLPGAPRRTLRRRRRTPRSRRRCRATSVVAGRERDCVASANAASAGCQAPAPVDARSGGSPSALTMMSRQMAGVDDRQRDGVAASSSSRRASRIARLRSSRTAPD